MKLTEQTLLKLVEEIMNEADMLTLEFVPFQETGAPNPVQEPGAALQPHFNHPDFSQDKLRQLASKIAGMFPSGGNEALQKGILAALVTDVIRHHGASAGSEEAMEYIQSGENSHLKDKLR